MEGSWESLECRIEEMNDEDAPEDPSLHFGVQRVATVSMTFDMAE
jgi:hypothetical protein